MDDLRRLVMQMNDEFKEHKNRTESRFEKHENRMDKQDNRMDGMDKTQTIQGEQIKGIERSLDAIHDDTRWLRRTFTGAAITALIGGLGSLVFFAIRLGGG